MRARRARRTNVRDVLLLAQKAEGVGREAAVADGKVHVAAHCVLLDNIHQRTHRLGRLTTADVAPARRAASSVRTILPAALLVDTFEGQAPLERVELSRCATKPIEHLLVVGQRARGGAEGEHRVTVSAVSDADADAVSLRRLVPRGSCQSQRTFSGYSGYILYLLTTTCTT